ncbi:hypothetical protein Tco_0831958 [Tanacetum coccineum]
MNRTGALVFVDKIASKLVIFQGPRKVWEHYLEGKLCQIVVRYRCAKTELITPNLICPSTHKLLHSFGGDSGPDLSFDKSTSLEHLFSLACVSLAGASKLPLSSGCSEGDYTSSCPPSLTWLACDPHVFLAMCHALKGADGNGGAPFLEASLYCTPPATVHTVIPDPTPEDLAVGIPSAKILAKAEASQKRKASTSGATLSHVAKRTSDDDDDACVEIMLVTPIRSAIVIPSLGNQGGSSAAPTAEGPDSRDSQGKGIMVDDAAALFVDFFHFSAGPYYATYPKGGIAGNYEFTREELYDDKLTTKMSVLHCMMMSHGGDLLACYGGLLQSHHEYVLSTASRTKGYEEKFKAKGNERNKKIKSLTKSLDNLHVEVARLSTDLNRATVLEGEKNEEILHLKTTPLKFSSFFCGHAGFEHGLIMHRTKDEFADVLKKMAHFVPGAQVNAMVDVPDPEMTDGATHAKSGSAFVQGTSYVLDDVAEVTVVGPKHVSSSPTDVVVSFFVSEKGYGSLLSSAADEEAAANPSRV